MSSGPEARNEKPRSAWSNCIDETPRSSATPSTSSTPSAAKQLGHVAEAAFDQAQPRRIALGKRLAGGDGVGIAVDGDHLAVGAIEHRRRVAAGAERAVEIAAAVARLQRVDDFARENGDMAGGVHASPPPEAAHEGRHLVAIGVAAGLPAAGIPQLELVALADQHHAVADLEHAGELGRQGEAAVRLHGNGAGAGRQIARGIEGLVVERHLERALGAERFGAQPVEHGVEARARIAVHDPGQVGGVIEDEGAAIVGRQLVTEGSGQQDPAFLIELDQDFGPKCHGPFPLYPAAGAPRPCANCYTGCNGISWDFQGSNHQ